MNRMKPLALAFFGLSSLLAGTANADEILLDPPNTVGPAQVMVISVAGQYRLAHSFTLSGTNTGIRITVPNVTLDLGGATIEGNLRCTRGVSYGNSCVTNATTAGAIDVTLSQDGLVRIVNGTVQGGLGRGISITGATYGRVELEDLIVAHSRNDGLHSDLAATSVKHSRFYQNGGTGLYLNGTDSAASDVHADFNGVDGIYGANGTKVEHSSADNNGVAGIDLPIRGTADAVVASDNGGAGFLGVSSVINSQARGNHGAGFDQVKLLLDSEAISNTLSGYSIGAGTGCYSRLRASGNGSPQISAAAVALTTTCP